MEFDSPFAKLQSNFELREKIMWSLLIFGALCFLLADSAAELLAKGQSGQSFYANAATASSTAFKIYLWGGVSFVTGLVERIALEMATLRQQENTDQINDVAQSEDQSRTGKSA